MPWSCGTRTWRLLTNQLTKFKFTLTSLGALFDVEAARLHRWAVAHFVERAACTADWFECSRDRAHRRTTLGRRQCTHSPPRQTLAIPLARAGTARWPRMQSGPGSLPIHARVLLHASASSTPHHPRLLALGIRVDQSWLRGLCACIELLRRRREQRSGGSAVDRERLNARNL